MYLMIKSLNNTYLLNNPNKKELIFLDPSVIPQLLSLLVLLILSSFFSSAETAFVSVNQMRMRSLAESGNRKAQRVLAITEDPSKMLSAILIGNNLVNISASSLATAITLSLWGNAAISISTGLLTLLILIFGEITPKTIATINANKIALFYSSIIWFLMVILTPIIFLVNQLAKGILTIIGFNPEKHHVTITEAELRTIVKVSHEEGVIESNEHQMINNVFDFGDSQAKDVMIPRIDMSCISVDTGYQEIKEVFRREKFTRLPVYENTSENVIGIINVKDLLLWDDPSQFNILDILRKPYYTFEYKYLSELMNELKKTSNNFTLVVDEYGSTVGMITLEDLLEEIVGEIRDEYDEDEEDEIIKINDDEYILSGTARLNDLEEIFELPEQEEDFDSISGLIIMYLERFPQPGDKVIIGNLQLIVEECDKNRIHKVHAYITHNDLYDIPVKE